MMSVRDKKKAYVEKSLLGNYHIVFNWKHDIMGYIMFNSEWGIWCFFPGELTYYGPEFLRSLASQIEDIQEADEATWE